jgi:two-component system CheB/CheR fusion protein
VARRARGRPPRRSPAGPARAPAPSCAKRLTAFILERLAPAHLVVTGDGDVVHQSAGLGKYLEPAAGAPSRQLLSMAPARPAAGAAARAARVGETRRPAVRPRVEVDVDDRRQAIELTVAPLPAGDGADPLFVVAVR